MRQILLIAFMTCSLCACSQMSIGKISQLVGKKQGDKVGGSKGSTFSQIRDRLFSKYPTILKGNIDTVYFMEKFEMEEGTYLGLIWTNRDTVTYSSFGKEIKLNSRNAFTSRAINLVSSWDVKSIRKEELRYGNTERHVFIARAVVKGNQCMIDTMTIRDLIIDY